MYGTGADVVGHKKAAQALLKKKRKIRRFFKGGYLAPAPTFLLSRMATVFPRVANVLAKQAPPIPPPVNNDCSVVSCRTNHH